MQTHMYILQSLMLNQDYQRLPNDFILLSSVPSTDLSQFP